MLAFLLALTLADWVPTRWFSTDIRSLDLLENSPINCLLIDQRDLDASFVRAARERGLDILAIIRAPRDIDHLKDLQLSGFVVEGSWTLPEASAVKLSVLYLRDRLRVDASDPAFIGTRQGFWPGIRTDETGISTGPTSTPWINTNTGFLRWLRSRSDAVIWIGHRLPERAVIPVSSYLHAICDAAFSGARWILELDASFGKRLLAGEEKARADWHRISMVLSYFQRNKAWANYKPWGKLCVELEGPPALLSGSLLDMLASQHLHARLTPGPDCGATVTLTKHRSRPRHYSPPANWRFPAPEEGAFSISEPEADSLRFLWDLLRTGQFRPWVAARLFNAHAALSNLVISPAGRRALLHVVNYTGFPQEDLTIYLGPEWKSAQLHRPEHPAKPVELLRNQTGWSIEIDRITTIGTLELVR